MVETGPDYLQVEIRACNGAFTKGLETIKQTRYYPVQAQVTDGTGQLGEASSTTDSQAQVTAGNRPVDVQHCASSPSVSNDEFRQTASECLDHSPVASHTRSQVKQ